ncbi:MAG: carboxypeptidase regulatory-like domain-containing protein [Intrasporangiaceae bacterium]|nr:carboxypeptidase regulatory-like domain-containing protein [Intrasporangiaceae bacterium]
MTHADDLDRLAAAALDETDERVLSELRALWSAGDPPPGGLTERIRFAMTVASLEAEVARISEESLAGSGVRSYERASTVTFTSGSLSAMIDIETGDEDRVRVSGWVSEASVEVELRERHRSRTTDVDASGRFGFAAVERGLVHFVLRRTDDPSARPVITPTIEL